MTTTARTFIIQLVEKYITLLEGSWAYRIGGRESSTRQYLVILGYRQGMQKYCGWERVSIPWPCSIFALFSHIWFRYVWMVLRCAAVWFPSKLDRPLATKIKRPYKNGAHFSITWMLEVLAFIFADILLRPFSGKYFEKCGTSNKGKTWRELKAPAFFSDIDTPGAHIKSRGQWMKHSLEMTKWNGVLGHPIVGCNWPKLAVWPAARNFGWNEPKCPSNFPKWKKTAVYLFIAQRKVPENIIKENTLERSRTT